MCPRTRVHPLYTLRRHGEGRGLIWTFAWNYLENYSTRNIFQTELGGRSFSSCRLACNIKKNTLISDREKQTIFRRFSTTIPFFFFFAKGKNFKKFEKQTLSIFLPSPSCSSKQRVRLFRIDTTLLSLSLFFFKPNRTTRASVFSRRYIFHPRRPKGMKGERQVKIRGERISANG